MPCHAQELTQRLKAHYKAADAKPGAPPPPPEGGLVMSLQEALPLQVGLLMGDGGEIDIPCLPLS